MDDIKEFLKGQSNKVLVILLILTLPALGYLLWDKINAPVNTSNEEISTLTQEFNTLKQAFILNQREYEAFKTSVYNNQTKQKNYTDKQIEFVVKNSEGKNKEMMLQVLELTKDKPEPMQMIAENKHDTVFQTKIERIVVEKEIEKPIPVDTVIKKKGLSKLKFWK
jgi:hypothetical protein